MGVLVPTGSVGVKVNHGFTVSVSENRYKKYGAPQLDFIFTAGSIENVVTSENPISFVRNSPATFYDSSGILRTVSANEPRFDHNPLTGEKLGLLIEESRTNYSPRVYGFSAGASTSKELYGYTLPDGTVGRLKYHAYITSSSYEIYQSVDAVGGVGVNHVHSYYVKNISGYTVSFRYGVSNGKTATIPDDGKWYRLIVDNYVANGLNRIYNMYMCSSGGSATDPSVSGPMELLFWGENIEAGSFVTSYIPTPATFTSRASEATFYNENGIVSTASTDVARDDAYLPDENGVMRPAGLLLESAATNLLLHSEQFGLYSPSEVDVRPNNNLAPDLSFTAGSIVETTTTDYHQLFLYPIQATGNITLSGFIKNKQGTRNALLRFNDGTNDLGFYFNPSSGNTVGVLTGAGTTEPINYGSQKLGNDWYRIYVTGNVSSTGGSSSLYIIDNSTYSTHAGTGTDGFYIWGFQMEENSYPTSYIETPATFSSRSQTNSDSASFYQSDGTIGYAATNVARDNAYLPDENGTFYPAGLLLEEETTNLMTYSEDFNNWSNNTSITVSTDTTETNAPDGTQTADKITNTASETSISNNISSVTGTHTASVYVKYAGTTNWARIATGTGNPEVWFDINNGTVGTENNGAVGQIQSVSNGWYRCSITADFSGVSVVGIFPSTADGSTTEGNGNSLYVWGTQLETGSYATSYIPTTSGISTRGRDFISSGITSTRSADVSSGVTSTRQADDAIISGIAFSSFYNLTEGSFFVHGGPDQINSSSAQHLFSASDGSNSDQTRIKVNTGASGVNFNIRDGAVTQADIAISSVVAGNNDSKIAARYGANDFRIDVQGSSGTDTSGTVSSSLTQLAIGSRTNDRYLNGHIRRLTYWPTKLSDAQLERITQQ